MLIRDAHTHFFSRVFFETLAHQSGDAATVDQRLEELAKKAGLELPPADPVSLLERWLEQMGDAGVESMVTFASVPEEAEVVAQACKTSGGRLHGYSVFNPLAPDAAGKARRALSELGLRGVILFPALHHYHLADPACEPFLTELAKHRAVCVVHCGVLHVKIRDLLGLKRSYDPMFANPLGVVRPAGEHPDISFVIPHFGGGLLQETLLAGSHAENIYVDTSSSNNWMKARLEPFDLTGVFAAALQVFGPRRILFGTDSSVFPRGYRADLLANQRDALDALGLSTEDQEAIFGENLKRILG